MSSRERRRAVSCVAIHICSILVRENSEYRYSSSRDGTSLEAPLPPSPQCSAKQVQMEHTREFAPSRVHAAKLSPSRFFSSADALLTTLLSPRSVLGAGSASPSDAFLAAFFFPPLDPRSRFAARPST